jgi:signal peptidase I
MNTKHKFTKFWNFLKKDTWQSWIVSIILIIVFIKLIFFPTLSLITKTPLPLVVVESCSMYHESNFDEWWDKNKAWYESREISKTDFKSFNSKNGLNKGDIILVLGKEDYNIGDIIIFTAPTKHPLIHRIVTTSPISTKGDNGKTNPDQLSIEKNIPKNTILGRATIKIPLLGWIKLIFFEPFRPARDRGICK